MTSTPEPRAPWQTPNIETLTETGTRADGATARIRNGNGPQDSVSPTG